MTQEEKQLLLKVLCAMLPYEVKGKLYDSNYTAILKDVRYSCFYPLLVHPLECPLTNDECSLGVDDFKPYLRPMSSMTEEEDKEWQLYKNNIACSCDENLNERINELHDWFNEHHIDYRGLIPMGLALEASKDMYNIK